MKKVAIVSVDDQLLGLVQASVDVGELSNLEIDLVGVSSSGRAHIYGMVDLVVVDQLPDMDYDRLYIQFRSTEAGAIDVYGDNLYMEWTDYGKRDLNDRVVVITVIPENWFKPGTPQPESVDPVDLVAHLKAYSEQ